MRTIMHAIVLTVIGISAAAAQTPAAMAIRAKAGETIDLGQVFWLDQQTCQNLAIAKPDIEILTGPPGMTVEVKEEEVVPVASLCKNKITPPGVGHVLATVPEGIEATVAQLVIRVTHHAKDGDHTRNMSRTLLIAH